jgi:hypothetical protein
MNNSSVNEVVLIRFMEMHAKIYQEFFVSQLHPSELPV